MIDIRPQPGFQTAVALSKADVTIMGGAAGCGKSFIGLYLPLMYSEDPNLRAVYFRRTQKMIRESGALWDESMKLYPLFNAEPSESILKWRFRKGGIIDFVGIEYEKDLINFQGAQIGLEFFDELTHFTEKQFLFMISRNRGVFKEGLFGDGFMHKPQVFASCNPDPDSWVARWVNWYIDPDTGYPIPERNMRIRFYISIDDKILWGDSKKELFDRYPDYFNDEDFKKSGIHPSQLIKSFTFISGKIYDNAILTKNNPGYLASLKSMGEAEQERFLKGNWKIRSDNTGLYNNEAINRMFILKDGVEELKYKESIIGWEKDRMIVGTDYEYNNNFITCDAAKFGRDLCVIFVWKGMTVIHISIFYLSAPAEIHNEIQVLMHHFHVLRTNVCVDQDGVGGDVVKLGGYYGFMARREVARDETTKEKENYDKRKDQCYFASAAAVNADEVKVVLLPSTVKIYDKGSKHPRWSCMLKWNNEMIHVKELIIRQLRAIKRGKVEFEGAVNKYEGGNLKLCTNTKEEQKEILGHSPDFADNFMMRMDFKFRLIRKGSFKSY